MRSRRRRLVSARSALSVGAFALAIAVGGAVPPASAPSAARAAEAAAAPTDPATSPPSLIDETEACARVERFGAALLGLPIDQVELFALESAVIPGDPNRWVGGKVRRIGGTEAVVVFASLDTGEVIDGATLEARTQTGRAREGRIDPTLQRQLEAAAPTDRLTVAVLVRGGPREAVVASVRARYPTARFNGGMPDTGDDALNIRSGARSGTPTRRPPGERPSRSSPGQRPSG